MTRWGRLTYSLEPMPQAAFVRGGTYLYDVESIRRQKKPQGNLSSFNIGFIRNMHLFPKRTAYGRIHYTDKHKVAAVDFPGLIAAGHICRCRCTSTSNPGLIIYVLQQESRELVVPSKLVVWMRRGEASHPKTAACPQNEQMWFFYERVKLGDGESNCRKSPSVST